MGIFMHVVVLYFRSYMKFKITMNVGCLFHRSLFGARETASLKGCSPFSFRELLVRQEQHLGTEVHLCLVTLPELLNSPILQQFQGAFGRNAVPERKRYALDFVGGVSYIYCSKRSRLLAFRPLGRCIWVMNAYA